jgi:hypothetical protein
VGLVVRGLSAGNGVGPFNIALKPLQPSTCWKLHPSIAFTLVSHSNASFHLLFLGRLLRLIVVTANVVIVFWLLSPWYVPVKRRFLQEPHGVTYQNTKFFIVTAVKICSRDVMCLHWGTNWVFITQKTVFFIITAVKMTNLTSCLSFRNTTFRELNSVYAFICNLLFVGQ